MESERYLLAIGVYTRKGSGKKEELNLLFGNYPTTHLNFFIASLPIFTIVMTASNLIALILVYHFCQLEDIPLALRVIFAIIVSSLSVMRERELVLDLYSQFSKRSTKRD